MNRQQVISTRTQTLAGMVRRQLTAPGSLLLAGGIGFILGELTQNRAKPGHKKQDQQSTFNLQTMLSLITSAHALYAAIPLSWQQRVLNPSGHRQEPPTDSH